LGTDGSTKCSATWKEKVTPAGRRYCQLVVSARRTNASEFGGWATPDHHHHGTMEHDKALKRVLAKRDSPSTAPQVNLGDVAAIAAWPTPTALSFRESHQPGNNRSINKTVELASWNTPRATDGTHGGPNQSGGALPADAALAPWPTPMMKDGENYGGVRNPNKPMQTSSLAQSVRSGLIAGAMQSSSLAATASNVRLVLNAAMARWLMGYPATWDELSPNWQAWQRVQEAIASGACGDTATP
jgi:hypothetical protein